MFKFLKDKLKGAIDKFSKDVEERAEDIPVEEKEEKVEIQEEVQEESQENVEEEKKLVTQEQKTSKKQKEPQVSKAEPKQKVKDFSESFAEEEPEEKIEEVEKEIEEVEEEVKESSEAIEEKEGSKSITKRKEPKIIEKSKKESIEVTDEEIDQIEEDLLKEEEDEEEKEAEEIIGEEQGPLIKISESHGVIGEGSEEEQEEQEEEKEEQEEEKEEKKEEKKGFFSKLFRKKEEVEELEAVKEEKKKTQAEEEAPEEKSEEKKGIFGKVGEAITKKSLSEKEFEDIFWELEIVLLENNLALEVIEKIKTDLKKELVDTKVLRGKVEDIITNTLRKSISELFNIEKVDLLVNIKSKKPYVIAFVGVNGSGKTTTIAKFVNLLKKNNMTCVLAASDTFRAAAIQQLQEHADNLGVKIIKHDYGADPAAVAFDAIKYAQGKSIDVVLIDTAGRLHSNVNLMDELRKVIRVSNPDFKIFIGESITGNDCVEQATQFNTAVGVDGIILSKADVDEKGGAAVSVSYVTKKPILYLGTGQEYDDLVEFDKEAILSNLGL